MEIRQPSDAMERRQALAVLMARPESNAAEIEHQINTLVHYADKNGLSLDHCLMALEGNRCISTCLCVDAPGRTSSVFLPASCDHPGVASATVELLKRAEEQARLRGIHFLQGMIPPDAGNEALVFRQAGYERLTQLIYLEADPTCCPVPAAKLPAVTWTAYRPEVHELFSSVVLGTYEESLDCGSLNGVRDIEDILASHKAAGQFHPDWWLVASMDDQPVGVILLAEVRERWCCEVVYMGLLKPCRGRGYASTLLRRAFEIAQQHAMLNLTLTVDYRNTPALKLYTRFGFREVSRRDVWINVLQRAGAQGAN